MDKSSMSKSMATIEAALNNENLNDIKSMVRAVNHSLRQKIIVLLQENTEMTVTDIYTKLRLEQSIASQHLAILRESNVVNTERSGKFIYYSLNYSRIKKIEDIINCYLDETDEL